MNSLVVLAVTCVFHLTVNAQETDKHRIYGTCISFDDEEAYPEYKECVSCLNTAYNGAADTSDANVKSCIKKMPTRFSPCDSQEETKKCLMAEMLKHREETRQLFIANNKDVLTFKERIQLGQVWSAFMLYMSMAKDLPQKATGSIIVTVMPCFMPGLDLTKYDESEVEELSQDDEEESERVVREADTTRKIVKSMNRRTYRLYLCSMQKINADKEAKSIIKDFVRTYHGGVPAKVAQGYCNW